MDKKRIYRNWPFYRRFIETYHTVYSKNIHTIVPQENLCVKIIIIKVNKTHDDDGEVILEAIANHFD